MASDGHLRTQLLLGGGIGSGKSSVARFLVETGFLHIEADRVGADVLGPHTEATRTVAALWPKVVNAGIVDRQALATIVFSSSSDLEQLEQITHPLILEEIERLVAESSNDVVVEVPLRRLSPRGEWTRVAVISDEELRVERAVHRGGDAADVRRRVSVQASDAEWIEWADVVIENNGAWSTTASRVASVIREVSR